MDAAIFALARWLCDMQCILWLTSGLGFYYGVQVVQAFVLQGQRLDSCFGVGVCREGNGHVLSTLGWFLLKFNQPYFDLTH